jgi:hypothetical protein
MARQVAKCVRGTHQPGDNHTMVNVVPIKCERRTRRHANNSTIMNVAPMMVAESTAAFQGAGANPEEVEELMVWLKRHPAP